MQVFHSVLRFKIWPLRPFSKAGHGDVRLYEACAEMLAAQRGQLFLWLPVFVGAGSVLYFSLRVEPPFWLGGFAFILACLGFAASRFYSALRLPALFVLFISLGFIAAQWRSSDVYTPILQTQFEAKEVQGRVISIEHIDAKSARVLLGDVGIEGLEPQETPRRVRLKTRGPPDLRARMQVRALASLGPPSPPVMPGGFDFQRYMYFQGVGGIGFTFGNFEILSTPQYSGFSEVLENFRTNVSRRLVERLGDVGGVASALMVGQRKAITEEDEQAMRDSGLAHMLAISGLHVGLVFGFVFFMVRLIMAAMPAVALRWPIKKIAAVAGLLAAVFYMEVAGSTVPTQRAVLMLGVVFLAIMIDRAPFSMRLVAFAALVILLIAPESVLSASFQMSFAAVAALIAFYEAIRPWWSAWHKKAGVLRRCTLYVVGVSLTSVIATLATAPFALFHFQHVAVYSVLGNVLAIPLLAFIVMPALIVSFILWPFGLEGLGLVFVDWGLRQILWAAHFVAGLPDAVIGFSLWPGLAMVFFALAFTAVLLLRGRLRSIAALPFCTFLFIILNINQYDILFSLDSRLAAVRLESGAWAFSDTRKERFTREQWAQGLNLSEEVEVLAWPKEGFIEDLTCGEEGCRLQRHGRKIAFSRNLAGFHEDCSWADVVIAQDVVSACPGVLVLDRFDARDYGAHGLRINQDGALHIDRVEDARGQRPWVAAFQKTASQLKPQTD